MQDETSVWPFPDPALPACLGDVSFAANSPALVTNESEFSEYRLYTAGLELP